MIQKCIRNLQKKRETAKKYKLKVLELKEEKANLHTLVTREKALLNASKLIFEEDEDSSILVSYRQSTSESPAPFYKQSDRESLSLLDELSNTFHDFAEEQVFHSDKVNESQLRLVSPINQLQPKAHTFELNMFALEDHTPKGKQDHWDAQGGSLGQVRELVSSTHDLLKDFLIKMQTPRRRKLYRTCLLSRLTQSQLFQVGVSP